LNTKTNSFTWFSFLFSFKDLNINKFQLKLSNFQNSYLDFRFVYCCK
jgi:hypothetical protein